MLSLSPPSMSAPFNRTLPLPLSMPPAGNLSHGTHSSDVCCIGAQETRAHPVAAATWHPMQRDTQQRPPGSSHALPYSACYS